MIYIYTKDPKKYEWDNIGFIIMLIKFLRSRKITQFTFSCKTFPFFYQIFITIPRNISNHQNQFMMKNDGFIDCQRKSSSIIKRLTQNYICHGNKDCTHWQTKQFPSIGLSFENENFDIKREYTNYISVSKLILKSLIEKEGLDAQINGNNILISSERPLSNQDENNI